MADRKAIKIGISACLLGQNVRYDGTNKLSAIIVGTLGPHVEFIPFCPEVAIGLGTPRPPIQLVDVDGEVRALGVEDASLDPTLSLREYGRQTAQQLAGISGFIFKARSPSCGVKNVKLIRDGKISSETGTGLFAAKIIEAHPTFPVTQETELETAEQCKAFLQEVILFSAAATKGRIEGGIK